MLFWRGNVIFVDVRVSDKIYTLGELLEKDYDELIF